MGVLSSIAGITWHPVVASAIMITVLIAVTDAGLLTVWDDWSTDGGIVQMHHYSGGMTLSYTTYATHWQSNGQSESITVQGKFMKNDAWVWTRDPSKYYYVAEINGQQCARYPSGEGSYITGLTGFWTHHESGRWYNLDAWTFRINGAIPDHSKLKVYMVMVIEATIQSDWEGEFGWDGAWLESGKGEIFLYGDQGPFEEGETAEVFVKTGYTGVPNGWPIKIFPPADRADLTTMPIMTLTDDVENIISITIEPGWFKIGSTNEFRVVLYSNLFEYGFTQIFTIDLRARAPGTPEITRSWSGDTATFTVTSQRTYADIQYFIVSAWYGDITMPSLSDAESWIFYNKQHSVHAVGGNYTTTFTVQAKNIDGNIMVKAMARDVDGRSSSPVYVSLVVEDGAFEKENNVVTQPFILHWGVGLFIVMGLILCLVVAVHPKIPGSFKIKGIIGAIIFLIFVGIGIYVGYNPGVFI